MKRRAVDPIDREVLALKHFEQLSTAGGPTRPGVVHRLDRGTSGGGDRDEGASAVEYGLLVALIAAVIIGVIGFLGQDVLGAFNDIEDVLNGDQG